MKDRKDTKSASGKKIGRPRTLTDAQRAKKEKEHLLRLNKWHDLHMRDPKYREELKRREKERKAELMADAELGRMTRAFLMRLGQMIIGIATPRDVVSVPFEHKSDKELLAMKPARKPLTPEKAAAWAAKHGIDLDAWAKGEDGKKKGGK